MCLFLKFLFLPSSVITLEDERGGHHQVGERNGHKFTNIKKKNYSPKINLCNSNDYEDFHEGVKVKGTVFPFLSFCHFFSNIFCFLHQS